MVDIYNILCNLLNIEPLPNNGTTSVTKGISVAKPYSSACRSTHITHGTLTVLILLLILLFSKCVYIITWYCKVSYIFYTRFIEHLSKWNFCTRSGKIFRKKVIPGKEWYIFYMYKFLHYRYQSCVFAKKMIILSIILTRFVNYRAK